MLWLDLSKKERKSQPETFVESILRSTWGSPGGWATAAGGDGEAEALQRCFPARAAQRLRVRSSRGPSGPQRPRGASGGAPTRASPGRHGPVGAPCSCSCSRPRQPRPLIGPLALHVRRPASAIGPDARQDSPQASPRPSHRPGAEPGARLRQESGKSPPPPSRSPASGRLQPSPSLRGQPEERAGGASLSSLRSASCRPRCWFRWGCPHPLRPPFWVRESARPAPRACAAGRGRGDGGVGGVISWPRPLSRRAPSPAGEGGAECAVS